MLTTQNIMRKRNPDGSLVEPPDLPRIFGENEMQWIFWTKSKKWTDEAGTEVQRPEHIPLQPEEGGKKEKVVSLQCPECGFRAKSKRGLQIHSQACEVRKAEKVANEMMAKPAGEE